MSQKLTFEEVKSEIERIELETNQRIIETLSRCESSVGIRVLNTSFKREERQSAFPIQIDAVNWDKYFPEGMPEDLLILNNNNIFKIQQDTPQPTQS